MMGARRFMAKDQPHLLPSVLMRLCRRFSQRGNEECKHKPTIQQWRARQREEYTLLLDVLIVPLSFSHLHTYTNKSKSHLSARSSCLDGRRYFFPSKMPVSCFLAGSFCFSTLPCSHSPPAALFPPLLSLVVHAQRDKLTQATTSSSNRNLPPA